MMMEQMVHILNRKALPDIDPTLVCQDIVNSISANNCVVKMLRPYFLFRLPWSDGMKCIITSKDYTISYSLHNSYPTDIGNEDLFETVVVTPNRGRRRSRLELTYVNHEIFVINRTRPIETWLIDDIELDIPAEFKDDWIRDCRAIYMNLWRLISRSSR